ncbi:hypothetical protein Q1695_015568 [Nippostrongylus brasiliensis]|nr:hypothetical protein Q1695_015568 [Nippostrongylus brasiliensis]
MLPALLGLDVEDAGVWPKKSMRVVTSATPPRKRFSFYFKDLDDALSKLGPIRHVAAHNQFIGELFEPFPIGSQRRVVG